MVPSLTSSLFSRSRSLTLVQESLKKIISLPMVRFSFSKEEIRWLSSSSLASRISACCLSRLFSFSSSFLSFSSWELSCSREGLAVVFTSNRSVFLDEALSSSRLRFKWLRSLSSSLFSASSWAALAPADRRLSAERRSSRFSSSSWTFSFSRASSWKAMFFKVSSFFFRRRPSASRSMFSFSKEDTYRDGLVEDAVLLLHVLDPGLGADLAALAQRRHRLAHVLVLLLQAQHLEVGGQSSKVTFKVKRLPAHVFQDAFRGFSSPPCDRSCERRLGERFEKFTLQMFL
ncbi:hypothetical protein EYF80_026042 [Liparis tanakae]|uniref:Uncharacterized protein n=1 Tax=Liparis tanakae TaxID=230148 RepID=A0A4Z2HEL0_9TELE|nr:hypothetical protein EYF80_026042 [Liparis tanakae]